MKSTLYLCGAGNPEGVRLAIRINQVQQRWQKIMLVDDEPAKHGDRILGIEIIGSFELLADADPATSEAMNLVARTTGKRRAAQQRIEAYNIPLTSLIDPNVDTLGVEFGRNVTVYPGAVSSANAFVDDASVLFTRAVVGHGCRVGKFCVLAPGAVLNARVQLEDGVYVGANASVYPDLKIGAGATIGANSSAVQDVPAGASVIGAPGEILLVDHEPAAPHPAFEPSSQTVAAWSESPDAQQRYEETIADVWQEVLQVTKVNVQDNLFEIGGTSLLAIQLCKRISSATQHHLSLTDVFQFPTVRKLSQYLARQTNGDRSATSSSALAWRELAEIRRELLARRIDLRRHG